MSLRTWQVRDAALRVDGELDISIRNDPLSFALTSLKTACDAGELTVGSKSAEARKILDAGRRAVTVIHPELFPEAYIAAAQPLALAARHLVLLGHPLNFEEAKNAVEAADHLLTEPPAPATQTRTVLLEARAIGHRFAASEGTAGFGDLRQAVEDLVDTIQTRKHESDLLGEARAGLELAEVLRTYALHGISLEEDRSFQEALGFVASARDQTVASDDLPLNTVTAIERATTYAQRSASTFKTTHDLIGYARCLVIQSHLLLDHPDHDRTELSLSALQLADQSIALLTHPEAPYVRGCAYQARARALQLTDPEAATRAIEQSRTVLAEVSLAATASSLSLDESSE